MTLARIPTDLMSQALIEAAESRTATAENRAEVAEAHIERLGTVIDQLRGIIARNCGWLPHKDQLVLREAEAAREESR